MYLLCLIILYLTGKVSCISKNDIQRRSKSRDGRGLENIKDWSIKYNQPQLFPEPQIPEPWIQV